MSNIFRYESNINQANKVFVEVLTANSDSGKSFNLSDLVTKYAFDTLFSVTTSNIPGFMQGSNAAKLKVALEDWKVDFIASGSYMRLHLSITRVMRNMGYKKFDQQVLSHLNSIKAGEQRGLLHDLLKKTAMTKVEMVSARAACAALIVAESDAVVKHIGAALFYIYHDVNILQALRIEIARARINQPARLRDIIRNKEQMPLLYGALRESVRQWRESSDGTASDFELDVESVTFGQQGLSHDLHLAIITKIIMHVVTKFDMVVSAGVGEHHYSSATEAVAKRRGQSATKPSANASRDDAVSKWRTFAVDTATEYQKQVDSYVMPPRGAPIETVVHNITETFKPRGLSKAAEEAATKVERVAAMPPHLRKKEQPPAVSSV